jgi:hypothetical protein
MTADQEQATTAQANGRAPTAVPAATGPAAGEPCEDCGPKGYERAMGIAAIGIGVGFAVIALDLLGVPVFDWLAGLLGRAAPDSE